MFIGREKELAFLQQDYIGKAVMVYGKRRVGKTTLIQKALKSSSYRTVYFECLKGTMQDNINGLVQELVRAKLLPVPLNFSTLQDVFAYLNALPEKIVVVIDEYPYLKAMNDSATVDSVFQNIIDNRLANIELILSGSHIGMMKDALQEKNALYGRFAVTIKLNELNYLEAAKFYPDKTPYDKAAHYAVFGGSPFVNQALQPTATIRENIISTILNPMSAIYLYASQLLLSDYSVKINAERIFSVIGNGKKRYTEIEDKLDVKKTGNLSKQIKSLIDLEIIARNSPINKIGDNKKSTFEINDNLLRFYFTFIYKNASALQVLGAEAFYDEYIAPALTDFIKACLNATDWCRADYEYFRGGGYSSHFRCKAEMPVTMLRFNIVEGIGPVLQIAEGWTADLPDEIHNTIDKRTDPTWPTTWFCPRLTGQGAFTDVYSVMANWGANHGVTVYGHVGADLITLASMLRIPVTMHNVPAEKVYRPHAWASFGTQDQQAADYAACKQYGPLYR